MDCSQDQSGYKCKAVVNKSTNISFKNYLLLSTIWSLFTVTPSWTNTKNDVLFITGDWNAKVGSQEIPEVTGKFGLGNTKWSRAKVSRVLPRECTGHSKHPLPKTREDSTNGHHQMVNTKISLTIFFAVKDGEALYSQQKQDRELTVAQSMNSLLPNSDLNWRK